MLKNPYFNDEKETIDVTPVVGAIYDVQRTVENIQIPEPKDAVEVTNLDDVHLAIHKELSRFLKKLSLIIEKNKVQFPKSLEVSNFPKQKEHPSSISVNNLSELSGLLQELLSAIQGINFNPQINVQSPEVNVAPPLVSVPAPIVNVPSTTIDIRSLLEALKPISLLSKKAGNYVTVRLSDGNKFIKALASAADKIEKATSDPGIVYAGQAGISKDEYKAAQKELYTTATSVNDSVTVGIASTKILDARANRISAVLTNDSDSVIYISKGDSATLNKGIRLNAGGGATVIDDWYGAVYAISSGADKNLCYCETY